MFCYIILSIIRTIKSIVLSFIQEILNTGNDSGYFPDSRTKNKLKLMSNENQLN